MGFGRLVKVKSASSDGAYATVGYLVAEQDPNRAVKIVRCEIAGPVDEIVAVSRVSEELLDALHIAPGEFRRADGRPPHSQTPADY